MGSVGAALAIGSALRAGAPVLANLEEPVRITSRTTRTDLVTGDSVFEGGVVVRYGPTTIVADRVEANQRKKTGRAVGNVLVTDPDGNFQTRDLSLDWSEGAQTGVAYDVTGNVAGARFRARKATIGPELWVLEDVVGTTCQERTPFYEVSTPRLEVRPGKRGRVEKPRIRLLGLPGVQLPTQTFNLDRRVNGLRVPSIVYRRDSGLGVGWNGQFLLDSQTAGAFTVGSFGGIPPESGIGITRSFVTADRAGQLITPRDDLSERFAFGYFDTVETDSPRWGYDFLKTPRDSVTVQSQINRGALLGPLNTFYSKPLEAIYERGGTVGNVALLGQARLQRIYSTNRGPLDRGVLSLTALPAPVPLARRLDALLQFDANGYAGGRATGWARGGAGVVWNPVGGLRLGAARYLSASSGRFDFEPDRLFATDETVLRTDLQIGGTRLRYVWKHDSRLGWYDREYSVNQVFGCIEAFLIYRRFPQTYNIGFKLRIDRFVDLLQRRKFDRSARPSPR